MILLIDNYDSFSYNLYQMLGALDSNIKVARNDEITLREIESLRPTLIVLSPGPKTPQDAGICIEVARNLGAKIPIFGVCLGHQAICVAFGGEVSHAKSIMHGKTSLIDFTPHSALFCGLAPKIQVARYHSLAITKMPDSLEILARADDGEIMAITHKSAPIFGVQFHPESILTPQGAQILENVYAFANAFKKDEK